MYSQQDALIEAEPSLKNAYRAPSYYRNGFGFLSSLAHAPTVETFPPAEVLTISPPNVGGALFSQVALRVFDLNVGVGEYESPLQDYARILPHGRAHTVLNTLQAS